MNAADQLEHEAEEWSVRLTKAGRVALAPAEWATVGRDDGALIRCDGTTVTILAKELTAVIAPDAA